MTLGSTDSAYNGEEEERDGCCITKERRCHMGNDKATLLLAHVAACVSTGPGHTVARVWTHGWCHCVTSVLHRHVHGLLVHAEGVMRVPPLLEHCCTSSAPPHIYACHASLAASFSRAVSWHTIAICCPRLPLMF